MIRWLSICENYSLTFRLELYQRTSEKRRRLKKGWGKEHRAVPRLLWAGVSVVVVVVVAAAVCFMCMIKHREGNEKRRRQASLDSCTLKGHRGDAALLRLISLLFTLQVSPHPSDLLLQCCLIPSSIYIVHILALTSFLFLYFFHYFLSDQCWLFPKNLYFLLCKSL